MDVASLIEKLNNILNAKDALEANSVIIGLQSTVFSIQKENMKLVSEISELKNKLLDYETWEEEKKKYETVAISHLTFVRKLIGALQYVCPVCFEKDKMPIHLMPPADRPAGRLFCPSCKTVFPSNL